MKKTDFIQLAQGSTIENVIRGRITYPDMHGSMRVQSVRPFVERIEELEKVIQMCFDDACKPSGKVSKKTVLELMKHADTAA